MRYQETVMQTERDDTNPREKQTERERIEQDIRAFLDRGGQIERLTTDAISDNPNSYGYNDTSREKALRAARRGGATQRRGGV